MKETFYFSHDYSARNDPKLVKLQMKIGHEGKGIYWDLIEMLYEQEGYLLLADIETYSFELRIDVEKLKKVIKEFDLFKINNDYFYSESVLNRLKLRNIKSKNSSDSAKKRWVQERKNKNEIFNESGQLYILLCYSTDESFIKIGITENSISRRYTSDKIPYHYEILAQYFSLKYIELESYFLSKISNFSYTPRLKFGGCNECYTTDSIDVIKNIEPDNLIISQKNFNTILLRRNTIKESKVKEINNIYNQFLSSFNSITLKKFRGTKKDQSQFNARINEGFSLDDFEKSIKNCFNDPFHKENPHYLTPEFITRSDKLQKYLNVTNGEPSRPKLSSRFEPNPDWKYP
jgi:uncharacterized phage protein (TIGR02220 family)